MEGARRAVAVADLLEVPKQEEDTTATAVAAAELEKEVPVPKQEDTTATAIAAADLEKELPKQEDTTSSGAADDEEKEAAGMKRNLTKTGFKSPYDSDYDDEPYECNSGDDVEDGNKEPFIEKEAQKIREKGKAAYFRRGMFRCPYCTRKPKPRDGIYEHLMSHARGLSRSAEDIKTRGRACSPPEGSRMLWLLLFCFTDHKEWVDWLATGNISIQLSDVDSNINSNNYRWVRWPWRQHHHRWSRA
ncbi:hypothetical protein D1007_39956 [Hordeum vulgare]|nr:hypothetical protein D1007_39956 [Hordeum vulgare]